MYEKEKYIELNFSVKYHDCITVWEKATILQINKQEYNGNCI